MLNCPHVDKQKDVVDSITSPMKDIVSTLTINEVIEWIKEHILLVVIILIIIMSD